MLNYQRVSGPFWMLPYMESTESDGDLAKIGPSDVSFVCLPRALLGPSPEDLDNTSCKLCCKYAPWTSVQYCSILFNVHPREVGTTPKKTNYFATL